MGIQSVLLMEEANHPDTMTVLAATTGALTFAAMVAVFPAAIAPAIGIALDVSPSLVGIQISLLYFGAMLTSLTGGAMNQRLGACRTTQVALALLAIGAGLMAIGTLPLFIFASIIMGLGYGLTNPAASHLLVRFTENHRRGLVFSIKQTGVPLGGMLAGAIAPLLAVAFDWRVAVISLLIPALAGLILLQQRRPRWDGDRSRVSTWRLAPFADLALVWRHPPLRLLALASFFFSASQLCLTVFTVTMLVEDIHLTLVHAGFTLALIQVIGVIGRMLWGWIADVIGNGLTALLLVNTVSLSGSLLVTQMSDAWPIWLITGVLCLFALGTLSWNGVYLAEVARVAPAGEVARASGGALFLTYAGVMVGPSAFTLMQPLIGSYTQTFLIVAVGTAVGMILIWRARQLHTHQPPAEDQ